MNLKSRNHKFTQRGHIECEIEHPVYGWIPFAATPDDHEDYGRELFAELKALHDDVGRPDFVIPAYEPPVRTPEEIARENYLNSPHGRLETKLEQDELFAALLSVMEESDPQAKVKLLARIR